MLYATHPITSDHYHINCSASFTFSSFATTLLSPLILPTPIIRPRPAFNRTPPWPKGHPLRSIQTQETTSTLATRTVLWSNIPRTYCVSRDLDPSLPALSNVMQCNAPLKTLPRSISHLISSRIATATATATHCTTLHHIMRVMREWLGWEFQILYFRGYRDWQYAVEMKWDEETDGLGWYSVMWCCKLCEIVKAARYGGE